MQCPKAGGVLLLVLVVIMCVIISEILKCLKCDTSKKKTKKQHLKSVDGLEVFLLVPVYSLFWHAWKTPHFSRDTQIRHTAVNLTTVIKLRSCKLLFKIISLKIYLFLDHFMQSYCYSFVVCSFLWLFIDLLQSVYLC